MCIGWGVMFFYRLKKPVCTAENNGLQTGFYQYNNFLRQCSLRLAFIAKRGILISH